MEWDSKLTDSTVEERDGARGKEYIGLRRLTCAQRHKVKPRCQSISDMTSFIFIYITSKIESCVVVI
jgi:hypothetical protein